VIVSLYTNRLATEAETEKTMARSNSRSTRTTRSTRTVRPSSARTTRPTRSTSTTTPRAGVEDRRSSDKRTLKYFNFEYNRDDVSHARGANSVTITDRSNVGNSVSLSLQEARSLYAFLASQLSTR
jgi:hypothetical protein